MDFLRSLCARGSDRPPARRARPPIASEGENSTWIDQDRRMLWRLPNFFDLAAFSSFLSSTTLRNDLQVSCTSSHTDCYFILSNTTMFRLFTSVLLALSVASAVTSTPFSRGVVAPTLFGIRGGGLFGGKEDQKT